MAPARSTVPVVSGFGGDAFTTRTRLRFLAAFGGFRLATVRPVAFRLAPFFLVLLPVLFLAMNPPAVT